MKSNARIRSLPIGSDTLSIGRTHLMENKSPNRKTIVILELEGDDARRFAAYMEREHIAKKAPAAKKLMLDRLDELEKKAA